MTAEDKQALRFFGRAALMVVPMLAVLLFTFAVRNRGNNLTLDDPNPAVRVAAVRATGYHANVELLTKALHDENADVRMAAAIKLRSRREEAGPSAKALIALLKDEHQSIRREAVEALSAIGAPAAQALVEALNDPDPRVRLGAIAGLGDVGRPKEGRERSPEELALVIPVLEKLQTDENADVRREASARLRYLGRPPYDGG